MLAEEEQPAPTKDAEAAAVEGEDPAQEPAPPSFTITVTVKVREGETFVCFYLAKAGGGVLCTSECVYHRRVRAPTHTAWRGGVRCLHSVTRGVERLRSALLLLSRPSWICGGLDLVFFCRWPFGHPFLARAHFSFPTTTRRRPTARTHGAFGWRMRRGGK